MIATPETPYKPLCAGAWAVPPSERMLDNGNEYFTCSVCGEPCDDPSRESIGRSDEGRLRQQVLKLARYANTLTPYKLDDPLDPMVAAALDAWVDEAMRDAQTTGVAWAIGIVDELHIGTPDSDTTDRLFKALKNTIRDRYKVETGVDPAPTYPIKASLST